MMGIIVKIRKYPKPQDRIIAKAVLEKDMQSCIRSSFSRNGGQCATDKCQKMGRNLQSAKGVNEKGCFHCPYRQSDRYCFPCMKKLLERTEVRGT